MKQEELSKINEIGWNQAAYQAWVHRHGSPSSYSQLLKENPKKTVSHYLGYMGDVKGKKIINLLGSKGNKAVSLALLGASVTVVDISVGNRQYATELSIALGKSHLCGLLSHQLRRIEPLNAEQRANTKQPSKSGPSMAVLVI